MDLGTNVMSKTSASNADGDDGGVEFDVVVDNSCLASELRHSANT